MASASLIREARLVQNPALGALLIWRFACGYAENHRTGDNPLLQLAFVVLPLLYDREVFEELQGTRAGLHAFAEKFSRAENSKSDLLLGIHAHVDDFRSQSLEAIRMAVHCRLITIAPTSGKVIPLSTARPSGLPNSINSFMTNAEKFGEWSAGLSLFEIQSILRVQF